MNVWYNQHIDNFIKKYYCELPQSVLARLFNVSTTAIRNRYKNLGLTVPFETLQKFKLSGRIQPGQTPATKGKKQTEIYTPEALENIRRTQFKPGQRPATYKPPGSERITKDGYIQIKIADPKNVEIKTPLFVRTKPRTNTAGLSCKVQRRQQIKF